MADFAIGTTVAAQTTAVTEDANESLLDEKLRSFASR